MRNRFGNKGYVQLKNPSLTTSNQGDNVEAEADEAKAGTADTTSFFGSFFSSLRETPNDSPPRDNPVRSIGQGKLPFPNLKSIVLNAFASERDHEIEAAKFLIKQYDVNQADEEGKTLLHYACDNGNADLFKFLIEMKANVNQATNDKRTPIYIASEKGKSAIVEELILKGADPSLPTNDGMNPIIIASKNGHHDVVEKLISAKVNVNQVAINGDTPILLASREGHSEVVAKLIEAKADLTTNEKNGLNPLFLAVEKNHLGVVNEFIKAGVDLNKFARRSDEAPHMIESYGNAIEAPLHIATAKGFTKVVSALLAGGADANQPNVYGATPLLMSVTKRDINTNVVKALLDAKADPTLVSCGSSPLSAAIKLGNLKVLELFKKAQNERVVNLGQAPEAGILTPQTPRYNTPDKTTVSPPVQAMEGAKTREGDENALLNACFYGDINNVRLLIKQNANVNQTTKNGATPIIYASELGYHGVVEELIQAGADVNKAREDGASPILFASTNGHHGVVRELIGAGANANKAMTDGTTPLILASQQGHDGVVRELIGAGANVNQAREDELAPLIIASKNGHDGVVKELIGAGANVNQARKDGVTPLMMASQEGHYKVVIELIGAGANANKAMTDGTNPLILASQNGHKDVVETLFYLGGADSKCLTEIDFLGNEVIRDPIQKLFPLYPGMKELIERITSDEEIKIRDKKLNQDPTPSADTTRLSTKAQPNATRLAGAYRELP